MPSVSNEPRLIEPPARRWLSIVKPRLATCIQACCSRFNKRHSRCRCCIVNHYSFPQRFARVDKPRVLWASGLIIVVIFHRFEVKRGRVVERMISYWPIRSWCGSTHITLLQVGNVSKPTNLAIEERALRRSKIFAKPKVNIMDNHIAGDGIDLKYNWCPAHQIRKCAASHSVIKTRPLVADHAICITRPASHRHSCRIGILP